jgi:tetratricopeptide (TPR) repeat protein
MIRRISPIVFLAALLATTLLQAQAPGTKDKEPSGGAQIYEDIEVMCRLLDDKLYSQYLKFLQQPAYPFSDSATPDVSNFGYYEKGYRQLAQTSGWLVPNQGQPPYRVPHFEGVYLKEKGVAVFTATLPVADGDLTGVSPPPDKKPTSDWDRMRKQLRRERTEEEKSQPQKSQSLAEIILHVLAENGHHLQIGDNESVSVVVTLRSPDGRSGVWPGYPGGPADPYDMNIRSQGLGTPRDLWKKPDVSTSPSKTPEKPKNPAEEYILLGDLHRKQGKLDDALTAYRKALELAGNDTRQKAVVMLKIVEVLKEQNKDKEAQDEFQKAAEFLKASGETKGSSVSTDGAAVPLPTKLIISATKKQLDSVAAGKMTFDEFAKAATVDLVNPHTPKK